MAAPAAKGIAATETAAGAPAGEFWSDGVVERGEAARDGGGLPGAVSSQEKSAVNLNSSTLKKEEAHLKDALSRPQGRYLVRQQPASALPSDRERSGRDQQRVPTRVDQRGSTTTMTMYLDSLVDDGDLKKAQVEAVRDDSVVVTLGGRKILYRFAPGQAVQQQRQK